MTRFGQLMRRVDNGFCHSLPWSEVTGNEIVIAYRLIEKGLLRMRTPNKQFPLRLVMTNHGLHQWGTFASDDGRNFGIRRAS